MQQLRETYHKKQPKIMIDSSSNALKVSRGTAEARRKSETDGRRLKRKTKHFLIITHSKWGAEDHFEGKFQENVSPSYQRF